MRTSSFSLFTILAPVALTGLVGASCATQTVVEGAGGSDTTATSASSTASSSSSSSGAGGCTVAADCGAMNDACNAGTCINGACVRAPTNENGACEDGLFCTSNDTCHQGECFAGDPNPCTPDDLCHVGVCDETTNKCVVTTGNEGGQCDDDDPCTTDGTCDAAGTCLKGPPVDCSVFNGKCTVGVCDPQLGCQAKPANDGTACNDGLFCTVNDMCMAGTCAGVPNNCAAPGNPCQIGACNELQKQCTAVPAPNGTTCDDQNTCTANETCTNGVCGGGMPTNQGAACQDGKACTQNDTCNNGVCGGTAVLACVNADGCCPAACSSVNDNDCNCNVNLGLTAIASMSPGGASPAFGPAQMNNNVGKTVCTFAWISNSQQPNGAWIQYDWPSPVKIGSIYIETENGLTPGAPCNSPAGRNIASGTVQWWNGASWVTSTTFAGLHSDVKLDLPTPVMTTKLRVFDMTTDPGNGNSMIFEWHVYASTGCMPPP